MLAADSSLSGAALRHAVLCCAVLCCAVLSQTLEQCDVRELTALFQTVEQCHTYVRLGLCYAALNCTVLYQQSSVAMSRQQRL